MEEIAKQYLALIGGWKVITILVLIVVDTILGIILAIKNKTFQWSRIADFINTSVLMMFGGYLVLGIVGMAEPALQAAVPVSLAVIDAKLLADVINKLKDFGLNVIPAAKTK
jgi:hypothetical protein